MNYKKNKYLKLAVALVAVSFCILVGYSLTNKEVTLVVNAEEKKVSTTTSYVESFLDEQNVKYDDNDIISAELDDKIESGDRIQVISVEEETVKENKEIPYKTELIKNANSTTGKKEVKKEGKTGEREVVYKLTYHDGDLVNKKYVDETVKEEPVTKVLEEVEDTNKIEKIKKSSNRSITAVKTSAVNSTSSKGKNMTVEATAYYGHSITATGTKPKWGTIAVDPTVIPYGTKVYIPQFDMVFTAEDCGSAIKGNKIDIFMNDSSSVYEWGRKTIEIQILND